MLNILYQLCFSKQPASIYTNDRETDKFHFGIVLAVNDDEIAIQLISPNGDDDGVMILGTPSVFRVETDGQYAEKMKKLYMHNPVSVFDGKIDEANILQSMLLIALKNNAVLSIELLDSGLNDVVGVVDAIEAEQCKIRQIDEYGYEDGFSYVFIRDITKISYLTENEQRILRLWKLSH